MIINYASPQTKFPSIESWLLILNPYELIQEEKIISIEQYERIQVNDIYLFRIVIVVRISFHKEYCMTILENIVNISDFL